MDFEGLASVLKALAYPLRLEMLDSVRFPKTIGDIRVSPGQLEEGDNPDRLVARQTLQVHLDKLVTAGLVKEDTTGGRRTYAVNPQKLYVLTEELRRLSTRHAGYGVGIDATTPVGPGPLQRPPPPNGAHLVLTHGVNEGRVFMLDPGFAKDGAWAIGRKEGLPVSLDYDPFVSSENSLVRQGQSEYTLEDVPGSRNGTHVNWDELGAGEARALRTGDIIGVGRTLLVFRH